MEENKENISDTEENDLQDEGRPPVDPNNKLYTFLSLLIFAVCYAAVQFIKQNVTLSYALYEDSPTAECVETVCGDIIGTNKLPAGCEVQYIRIHRNFDNNRIYMSVSLPVSENEDPDIEGLAKAFIPYDYGDILEDERFAVYPYPDMRADYVYGSSFVCINDPAKSCLIYEDGNGYTAVFIDLKYDSRVREALSDSEKINVK